MSYAVRENKGKFNILEKDSGVIIELDVEEKSARDICRKLNLGSGFNGWTPLFVASKIAVKES